MLIALAVPHRLSPMFEAEWIEEYLLATGNEIAVDAYLYSLQGIGAAAFGYLPRPSRWRNMSPNARPFLRAAGAFARTAWRLGAARAYLTYDAKYLERHRRACLPVPQSLRDGCRELAVAFSSRAADVLRAPALNAEPKHWLTFPWAPIHPLPECQQQFDAFSLLSSEDMALALKLALTASAELSRRRETQVWTLQSYTAVRWFAARIALTKFKNCRLLIAEHYDRWAMLADAVVRASQGMALTLVQHGALAGLSADGGAPVGRLHFRLPNRLTSVSRLSVYDAASESVFCQDVLTPECVARGVEVRTFKPMIGLTRMNPVGRTGVLIVGHTLCEPLHLALMQSLSSSGVDIDVFYKPHPTAAPSNQVGRQAWRVINERSTFPAVDLIIAYPSTLVTEYANVGVPAVVHALDAAPDIAPSLVAEVRARLSETTTVATASSGD